MAELTETSGGLSALEPGALPHPVGLNVVGVGPRVALTVAAVLAASLLPTTLALAVQVALSMALALSLGLATHLLRAWRGVALVTASLLVIYSWAYPGSTEFVWIFGVQGFQAGLFIAVRLLAFVSALYLLLLSTGPLALIRWAGDISESLGIMLSLTLSVVPVMSQQLHTTLAAQQARGLNVRGNVLAKMRAYLAVIIPVIVKSLVRAYDMAALLHVRGFGSGKRVVPARTLTAPSLATYVVAVAVVAVAVTLRVVG